MQDIENQVWTLIQTMNKCWTEGDPNDLNNFFHDNMVAITPTDKERLEGKDACVKGWSAFAQNTKIHFYKETNPKIDIYGDTAIVTYYYDMSFDMAGQTINTGGRDMMILVNENGEWRVVANQFSPFPGLTI